MQHARQNFHGIGAAECPPRGETFVEHRPQREQIAARGERSFARLFRRHVCRRAQHRPLGGGRSEDGGAVAGGRRGFAIQLGEPEVQDLHLAQFVDHDV